MKTILITGSTDGVGKSTAAKLALAGHRLILHGRNAEKLKQAIAEIKRTSGNDQITGYLADLSNLASLDALVSQIAEAHTSIDVLINNAGVFKSPRTVTAAGFDIRFAVNYLAPYSLTNKLLPLLRKSNAPRVINLSSAAQAPVSLKALTGDESLSDQTAYAQSKLALTLWSFQFAKTFPEAVVIPVNPGSFLNTKMVQEAYGQHAAPTSKGSDILFELATSEKYVDASGKYFDNDAGSFGHAHPDAYDQAKIDALLARTNQLLN